MRMVGGTVPEEAVRLALAARADALIDGPDPMVLSDEALIRLMLEAAQPSIVAASSGFSPAVHHADLVIFADGKGWTD
jgi:hypothetical protein